MTGISSCLNYSGSKKNGILISAILFICILQNGIAQNSIGPSPFSLKGGLNRSIINGKELDGTPTGFLGLELYVSLAMDNRLNQKWRFENEILFSFTDDYHFIEIPLRLKHQVHKKCSLAAGPKLDFILNKDDQNYNFNKFGISIEIGVQYDVTRRILAEFRYAFGLLPQISDFVLDIYDGKRNTIRLGLGYRF
ncbi:MAG: PorT family protein [Cyclobacteriaceae bacterium]|nr:PorT family protein [Cyclobacteriaceae bacterium]